MGDITRFRMKRLRCTKRISAEISRFTMITHHQLMSNQGAIGQNGYDINTENVVINLKDFLNILNYPAS